MFSEIFYPVAEPDSVPKVYRRYNYQHLPPPSDPTQLMPDLRRGLRGAEKASFWGKMKNIGRRLRRVKFGKDREVDQILRPDFPVAPPPTPVPPVPKVSPDIYIMPVGSPEFPLSSPPSQEEGLLAVPVRSSRSTKPPRQESLPPSPRPLPTPPGPPSCPIPEISCCLWANKPSTSTLTSTSTSTPTTPATTSTQSSQTPSLADTDEDPEEIEAARFFVEVAPFLFLVDNKCGFEDEDEDGDEDGTRTSHKTCSYSTPQT
ncbi:hypothetical protein BJV74DRAFT_41026 [Russula compacta]|nr:hypothetical protein BJV74DRAFT_41026 [Russula compacta]